MKIPSIFHQFPDEKSAREYLETIRWPDGPVCPHCGQSERVYRLKGKSTRKGLLKCGACRKQFSVTVGTIFESSHIPLHKWLIAVYLMCTSKKGISANQLHRMLNVTYKSAWFLAHRVREAMNDPIFVEQLGGPDKIVEADETFWGNKGKHKPGAHGFEHKMKIFSLVERGGDVRSFHIRRVDGKTLKPILREHVRKQTHIMTDEHGGYKDLDREFAGHSVVCHSRGEYSRGPAYTNTVEGYFSLLKRGLIGTFHHVGEQHLQRYVKEFDFRYNHRKVDDVEIAVRALMGIEGKRLYYYADKK